MSSFCKKKKLNILSLNSGGLKSIFQAVILEEIENYTKVPIYELFDGICCVSAGSLVGSFLSSPQKFTTKNLMDFYKTQVKDIFEVSIWQKIKTINGLFGSFYQNKLRNALEKQFGDVLLSQCLTNIMIVSYSMTFDRVKLFKSWDKHEDGKLYEISLASSCIPGCFNSVEIQNRDGVIESYADGALAASNASATFLSQIKRDQPEIDFHDITMVVLGVGSLDDKLPPNASLFTWLYSNNHSPLLNILLKHEIANEISKSLIGDENFYYFNPDLVVEEYNSTTNPSKLDELLHIAYQWRDRNISQIHELCNKLLNNKNLKMSSQVEN